MCPVGPRPQGVAVRSKSLQCLSARSLCSVMSAVFCVLCAVCCLALPCAHGVRRRGGGGGGWPRPALETERRKCRVSVRSSACVGDSVRTCSECIGRRKKSSAQRVARRNFLNVKLFARRFRSFEHRLRSFRPPAAPGFRLRAAPLGLSPLGMGRFLMCGHAAPRQQSGESKSAGRAPL